MQDNIRQIDIGEVFATTVQTVRERFWPLAGLWAVFFGVQMIFFMFAFFGLGGAAYAAGLTGADMDPAAMLGFGAGMFVFMIVFYFGYLFVLFAQQSAMATLASPIEWPDFANAVQRGFKGGLTLTAASVLLFVLFMIAAFVLMFAGLILQAAGDFGALLLSIITTIGGVYLMCRFALLLPVVAVDRVYNPITALIQSWAMSAGNVLRIFLVLLVFGIAALIMFGVPLMLVGLVVSGGAPSTFVQASGLMAWIMVIIFFAAYLVFAAGAVSTICAVHAQLSQRNAEHLADTFG
ncbi:MAG: hypothetical protein AAGK02_04530 [Pseudomonadota bacterium]